MAFLFSKSRRRSSVDQQDQYIPRRKASVDVHAEEPIQESTATGQTSAASKIAVLKSKLTSRSILNVSTKADDASPTSPQGRRFSLSGQNSSTGVSPNNSPTAAIGKGARRSSLATSSIPQVPLASSDRLANITASSPIYPPGTTVVDEPLIPINENAARRGSETAAFTNREGLNAVWKPIEPERRPLGASTQPTIRPSNLNNGNSDSSTSTIPMTPVSPTQSTAYTIRSPPTRPEIGKISIPPPNLPSRLASSSHYRESPSNTSSPGGWGARTPGPSSARTPGGTGWGMTIIPSTPLPRPIANLPTLNPPNGSAPGSRAGSRPTSSGGFAAGYGFPVMSNGSESNSAGSSRGGSAATSPVRGVEASPAEIRRAKQRMPVMLREPSHRPPPDAQEESDSESDSDESSSESGSGDNSSDAETETEESAPRRQRASSASAITRDRTGSASSEASTSSVSSDETAQAGITSSLGAAGQRSLLHNRPRQSSAPHHPAHARQLSVASITEENEEDGATGVDFGNYNMSSAPMQSSSPAARMSSEAANDHIRPGDRPRLSLPSLSSAGPSSNNSTTWDLATPGTPTAGASSFFPSPQMDASSSWTSFGASTPTGNVPRPSSQFYLQSQLPKSTLSRSNTASGQEAELESSPEVVQREFSPQARPTTNRDSGYFDSTVPPPTQTLSTVNATTNVIGEGSTPTQEDISGRRVSEELAPPLASLNLGPTVEAPSRALDIPETSLETPAAALPETPLNLAVIEHGTASDEPVLINTIPEPTQPTRPPGLRVTRPSLSKNASRSMVNLSLTAREQAGDSQPFTMPMSAGMDRTATNASVASNVSGRPLSGVRTPGSARSSADWTRPPPTPGIGMTQPFKFSAIPEPSQSPKQMVQNRQLQALGPSPLKRRRSMDDMHVKLPDYAPPAKGVYLPRPREEEGREKLPEYFCHVHIEGYLPRKMEFTSPGVQARDRSWKRHYFVIHGTALSVYKHDIHKVPLKAGDPHAVPEVDEADYDNLHVHRAGDLRRGSLASTSAAAAAEKRNSPVPQNNSPEASRRGSVDASGTGSTRDGLVAAAAARRASQSAGTSISTSSSNGPDSKDLALFTTSSNSSTNSGARRGSVSSSQLGHASSASAAHSGNIGVHLPFHGNNSLIKQYTLQNAESGLAADYTKKKNVVRVRVEGEQFLLQTESAKDVVDWIEAFQAATNVSLDLDVRPMPKIITLPRRRRRRRPGEPAPTAQATGQPDTEDTPEGNARAVAEAERQAAAAREQNIDDMERMLAEDQAA